MDHLNSDELKQIANFYKQKSHELEFQILELQLKNNKVSVELQNTRQNLEIARQELLEYKEKPVKKIKNK